MALLLDKRKLACNSLVSIITKFRKLLELIVLLRQKKKKLLLEFITVKSSLYI